MKKQNICKVKMNNLNIKKKLLLKVDCKKMLRFIEVI